jgi:cysteine desulfurase/selenocysteine lyase
MHASERYNATRESVKDFIGAKSSDEVVFTKGTTDGINLVVRSYVENFLNEGDEVIVSEMDHHSNFVPYQMLAERKKLQLKILKATETTEYSFDEFTKLFSSKTKFVSLQHVSNVTGTIHPIEKMIAFAHEKGAKVLIDGAQAMAHVPVNVQTLDADFYAFSSHKIYGPNGVGILYGKQELLEKMPPLQGGGDMIEKVTLEKTSYQKAPLKFEAGTPAIAEIIALKEAIDFIESFSKEKIFFHEQELLQYALEKLHQIQGCKILGKAPNQSAIISFLLDGLHPLDVGTLLDLRNVAVRTGHHCAQPFMNHWNIPGTIRISLGIYSTKEDIDAACDAIREIRSEILKS